MNDLGRILVWAAVQVTLLGLAAAVLYGWALRRGPSVAARVAGLALGLGVLLTLLALCPLPAWWTWQAGPSRAVEPMPVAFTLPEPMAADGGERRVLDRAITTPPSSDAGGGPGWSFAALRRAWEQSARATTPEAGPRWQWQGVVAVCVLAGAGLGLLRLLMGIYALRAWRRRSTPVDDPELLGLLESLRAEMGCRPVAVHESPDLGTAATVGWQRPLLLLPADWRTWGADERRAALAHELAHVCRADYLSGLVARVGAALHFYHPLIRWLAGRLRLQQELAADALGARYAGGRAAYLHALARLALRQDGRAPGWPAASFLFSHGTLMRRIAMLRAKDRSAAPRRPRLARGLVLAVMVGTALAASALRSPAQKNAEEATAHKSDSSRENPVPGQANRPGYALSLRLSDATPTPFDLSYLPAGAKGVMALRPAALLAMPGMKYYANKINQDVSLVLKQFKAARTFDLPVEEIDQLICPVQIAYNPKAKKGSRHMLMLSPLMIRTTHDFDWKKQLRSLVPNLAEVRRAGGVYYRGTFALAGATQFAALIPDARTLICGPEEHIRHFVGERKPRPNFPWTAEWKQVERDLIAIAVGVNAISATITDPELDPDTAALVRHVDHWTGGMSATDRLVFHAWASCPSAREGKLIVSELHRLGEKMHGAMKKHPDRLLKGELTAFLVAEALMEKAQVQRREGRVEIHSELRQNFADVVRAFVGAE